VQNYAVDNNNALDLNLFNATRPVPAFHLPLTPRLPCHEVSPHLEILRARQKHLVTRNSDSSRTPISSTTIEIFPFHYNVYAMDSPPSDLSPENESVRVAEAKDRESGFACGPKTIEPNTGSSRRTDEKLSVIA
jgi:hypothetical protein